LDCSELYRIRRIEYASLSDRLTRFGRQY